MSESVFCYSSSKIMVREVKCINERNPFLKITEVYRCSLFFHVWRSRIKEGLDFRLAGRKMER